MSLPFLCLIFRRHWKRNLAEYEVFDPSTSFPSIIVRDSEDEWTVLLLEAFQIDDNNNDDLELVYQSLRKCEVCTSVPGASLAEGRGLPVDQLAPELVHLLLHPLHLRVKPATGVFVIFTTSSPPWMMFFLLGVLAILYTISSFRKVSPGCISVVLIQQKWKNNSFSCRKGKEISRQLLLRESWFSFKRRRLTPLPAV